VLRALLAGEWVSFRGRHHRLDGVQVSPLPRHSVSLWLAGTTRASAERAGRLADGWLTSAGTSHAELRVQLDAYREGAARANRTPLPVLRRDVYVGESDAEAEAATEPIIREGYRGWGRDVLLLGRAERIVEQLDAYRTMGFSFVMVRHIVGDHNLMLRSFERLGREVLPRVRHL
jgi:alkanesulfonate monooxygenase SsuD/methylene tetrahydromethanopterin reductase-like flavin-dependent oxidoreductase (luciferase family)